MGKYIIRNVNFFIVFLLFLSLGALLGASIYFQKRFDNLSSDYILTLNRLKETSSSLETYQRQYLEAITNLNQTAQDVKQYDVLFTTKAAELEQTSTTLEKAQTDLASTKNKLSSTLADLESTQYSLTVKTDELKKKTLSYQILQGHHAEISKNYNQTQDTLKKVEAEKAQLKADLEECENP